MEWSQFIILLITIAGLFLWNRSEARTDNRRALDLIDAIQKEMKDFHGILCGLEERGRK